MSQRTTVFALVLLAGHLADANAQSAALTADVQRRITAIEPKVVA